MDLIHKIFVKRFSSVLSFNILSFGIGLFISFYIPNVFTIQDYAIWKELTLYFSFVGILHFGIIDGVYLKFGGETFNKIKYELREYLVYVIFVSVITSAIFYFIIKFWFAYNPKLLLILVISAVFSNIMTFFITTYNSVGKHTNAYSITLANKLIFIIGIVISVTVLSDKSIYSLIISFTLSYVILSSFLIFYLIMSSHHRKIIFRFERAYYAIKNGLPVLFANLVQLIIFNLDLIVVRIFADDNVFAFYGLSTTILKSLLIIFRSAKIVIFPIFSKDKSKLLKYYESLKSVGLILITIVIPLIYWIINKVILLLIPNYQSSLEIVIVLLYSLPYLFVIIVIQFNIFLLHKKQRRLFINSAISIFAGVFFNSFGFYYQNAKYVAVGTVLTYLFFSLINDHIIYNQLFAKKTKIENIIVVVPIICLFFSVYGLGLYASFIALFGLSPIIHRRLMILWGKKRK